MALVPYLEGLARVAADHGLPIWRGLAIEFPDDPTAWPITDEVLVGDRVLVAPVQEAGATARAVYLPAGLWYPWDGDGTFTGPTLVTATAALEDIPVLARAGAVVPMYPDGVMTLLGGATGVPDETSVGDDRVVRVYLGASGGFAEAGGLAYTLEQTADSWTGDFLFTFAGAPLSACATTPVAPCVEVAAHRAILHVLGPGELSVEEAGVVVAHLSVTGGAVDRALAIDLRY